MNSTLETHISQSAMHTLIAKMIRFYKHVKKETRKVSNYEHSEYFEQEIWW